MTKERLIEVLNESVFSKAFGDVYYYNDSSIMLSETMITMNLKHDNSTIGSICLDINSLDETFRIESLGVLTTVMVRINLGTIFYIN